nr:acyltransferase family protein [Kouleothrix sp.]
LAMFVWPLLVRVPEGAQQVAPPFVFLALLPLVVVLILVELSEGGMDARVLAILGVLSAINAVLRGLSAGVAGVELVFFLLILAGRVFGPGFGFALGATSLFASALLTAGVGPWLPYQMLVSAWIGMGAGLLPRLLSAPPLRWLGLRSYSLYLWHWPVFMVTRAQLDVDLTGLPLLGLRFAIAALLAELSYRLIETPFRTGAVARAWRRFVAARGALRWQLGMRWLAGAAVFMGMCVLLGRAVVNAQPPAAPAYLADATPTPLGQAAPAAEDATPAPPPAGNAAEATATPPADLAHGFMLEAPTLVSTYRQASAQAATPAPAPTLAATPAALGSVVAIGDSVMAGAVKPLGSLIAQIDVDAVRGRQAAAALKLLQERHDAGRLGDVVIIHIGNNGPFSQGQFDAMMQLLADVRQVVFVNVKVPRRWEAPNNAVIADGVQRYPNALLVDWHGATANRPELFWRDGIHLRPSGAQFYADLIAGSVRDSAARLGAR